MWQGAKYMKKAMKIELFLPCSDQNVTKLPIRLSNITQRKFRDAGRRPKRNRFWQGAKYLKKTRKPPLFCDVALQIAHSALEYNVTQIS
jgi:hypothetical protein